MKIKRIARFYYLRFIRLRGEPHELAMGLAFGIFCGMLPIVPFHMALSVTLAIIFKASKITAALGTWASNPLNWSMLYYLDYKIGASILGITRDDRIFFSIMESARNNEEWIGKILEIAGAGGTIIAAFLIGGLIIGVVTSIPSYFISLRIFSTLKSWREQKKELKGWER